MNNSILVDKLSFNITDEDRQNIQLFSEISFTVAPGESVALVGRSGTGKSSLLYLIAGMLPVEQGKIYLENEPISGMNKLAIDQLRNKKLGFVFQFHHLISDLTLLDNVMLPSLVAGTDVKTARKKATKILTRVGLDQRLNYYPSNISGGERQRVAIARALINDPVIFLADEPTGNLDVHTSEEIMQLLFKLAHEKQMTMFVVTHDLTIASKFSKQYLIHDNRLFTDLTLNQIKEKLVS